jgi:hypothetical protein
MATKENSQMLARSPSTPLQGDLLIWTTSKREPRQYICPRSAHGTVPSWTNKTWYMPRIKHNTVRYMVPCRIVPCGITIPWHFAMWHRTLPWHAVPYCTAQSSRGQFINDPYARSVMVMMSVRYGTICAYHVHNSYLAILVLGFGNSVRTIYRIRPTHMYFFLQLLMFQIYMRFVWCLYVAIKSTNEDIKQQRRVEVLQGGSGLGLLLPPKQCDW